MDYKVITPAEYFSNGESMPQNTHATAYAHLQMMQQGAPVSYPFHPAEVYGLQAGQSIRPPQSGAPTATYFHPSQGYFEANAGNAANLPNVTAYPTSMGQGPLQRIPATGRPVGSILNPPLNNSNTSNNSTGQNQPTTSQTEQNPKRFDGAGDEEGEAEEERSPDEIIQLLFTAKEKEAEAAEAANTATSTGNADDLINSELDDDDDEDDNADDDENEEAGTMDENVVLCQYEKVARTRNKWRCVFKSGLIHVNGVDYSFSRANGEFEW
jgi:transcription initiation factor TFIIA large subunit